MAPPSGPSAASATSPGSSESSYGALSTKESELQRKRARDRKSQQAMRDRTRWAISNLTEQVSSLTLQLDERTRDADMLGTRLRALETENAHLRTQNAALQLSLIGYSNPNGESEAGSARTPEPNPWEVPPLNTPPSCLADQILQNFLDSKAHERRLSPEKTAKKAAAYSSKPNLTSLLHKDRRTEDDISNVVGDIIRTYFEIDALPKQVASFYIMSTLLKWRVLMDKQSWDLMPEWLRPTPCQLITPHAAWIDRIPWPKVREYLVAHPAITLDQFAVTYSSSFSVTWPYDPSHIFMPSVHGPGSMDITTNPVYEEHIRQLKNWTVAEAFRNRFPEIAALIDES